MLTETPPFPPLPPPRLAHSHGGSRRAMSEPAGRVCEPPVGMGETRGFRRKRGGLSLVTFFAQTKKVTGRRATPGLHRHAQRTGQARRNTTVGWAASNPPWPPFYKGGNEGVTTVWRGMLTETPPFPPLPPPRLAHSHGGRRRAMSEPAGRVCEPPVGMGETRGFRRKRGGLSLVTFFAQTKKVTGRRATPGLARHAQHTGQARRDTTVGWAASNPPWPPFCKGGNDNTPGRHGEPMREDARRCIPPPLAQRGEWVRHPGAVSRSCRGRLRADAA